MLHTRNACVSSRLVLPGHRLHPKPPSSRRGASGLSPGIAGAILVAVPRIYTKTGDDGTTGLLYGGRISKADAATEAYGAVDEAVAAIGVARSLTENVAFAAELLRLQRDLFVVGADLATNPE